MASARRAAAENQVLSDFREEVRRWRRDPVYSVEHVLGVTTLTPYALPMLEAKKDMKRRLGRSPDDGDALALALAHRKQPVLQLYLL